MKLETWRNLRKKRIATLRQSLSLHIQHSSIMVRNDTKVIKWRTNETYWHCLINRKCHHLKPNFSFSSQNPKGWSWPKVQSLAIVKCLLESRKLDNMIHQPYKKDHSTATDLRLPLITLTERQLSRETYWEEILIGTSILLPHSLDMAKPDMKVPQLIPKI